MSYNVIHDIKNNVGTFSQRWNNLRCWDLYVDGSLYANLPAANVSFGSFGFINPGYILPDNNIIEFDLDRFPSSLLTLNSNGSVTFNESGNYSLKFWCNILKSDSATNYSLFIRKVSPSTNYARTVTPKLQAGNINNYSNCIVECIVNISAGESFVIYCQRESGASISVINTTIEAYLDIIKLN